MWAFGVVDEQPFVQVDLQRLDVVVEPLAHFHAEELVGDGDAEAVKQFIVVSARDPPQLKWSAFTYGFAPEDIVAKLLQVDVLRSQGM